MKDRISVIKRDGRRFDDIPASVVKDKIYHTRAEIPVEEGDFYERKLPNGIVELYEVIDAGFYDVGSFAGPHYQSEVRKTTKPRPQIASQITIYNVNGPNARVNIESVDASVNSVHLNPEELFSTLRSALSSAIKDDARLHAVHEKIEEMEESQGTRAYNGKYQEFVSMVADYMTILAPFIPALTQLMVL